MKIGQRTQLLGDPSLKIEKPYTIIGFPGGDVEVSRTTEGNYWVHVAVHSDLDVAGQPMGKIIDARMDAVGADCGLANRAMQSALKNHDVQHIAFLIQPTK